jgi:WS/DGAT/MGAT family acyltransferase
MRQLTSLDAEFLALETPRVYGHVSGLSIYDPSTAPGGTLTAQDLCRTVSERLHLLPPFTWKLAEVPFGLDHPYWVEDDAFDLDFHIRELALPAPGTHAQLADQVARIVARPLDRARPLWELYVIGGLDGDRVALLTKIHHAAVDGVSGAEILSALLDGSPEGREVPPQPARRPEHAPGPAELLARSLAGLPLQPVRALRHVPKVLANADRIPFNDALPGLGRVNRLTATAARTVLRSQRSAPVLPMPKARAPRTRFNGRISPHRRFAFGSVPLDRVKAIKDELGITVNDVVVALCATAVRDWLLERDELPAEPLVAMVPVSVRAPEEQGTFGNRVSAMIVPIPTDVADPRERLLRAHETMRAAKEQHRALPASILQDVTEFVPPAVFARAARTIQQVGTIPRMRPPLNLVVSNVPGPRRPLYLAGARLEGHYPVSVITEGMGLNITCMSYLDRIDVGIVVDRDQVDDAWPMLEAIDHALRDLDQVVCGRGRGAPRRRARGRTDVQDGLAARR